MNPCSTFKIAFAVAVLRAVRRGFIALDQPISEIDPGLKFSDADRGRQVTVRMLLSHTSGLDDTSTNPIDPRADLSSLPFLCPPGRAFRYTNVGFYLAATCVGNRCYGGLAHLLREEVLDPLTMRSTDIDSAPYGPFFPPTTVTDLIRLADAVVNDNAFLGPDLHAEMLRIHGDSWGWSPCRYYGLGIDIEVWPERRLYSHGGGIHPYGSDLLIDPAERAVAACLFDHPTGYAISAIEVMDRWLGRQTLVLQPRMTTCDWRPYIGRYTNGGVIEESTDSDAPALVWRGVRRNLRLVDDHLFISDDGLSIGLLPGEPHMISVNDFPPIGALPGMMLARQ